MVRRREAGLQSGFALVPDLGDRAAVREALRGIEVVVHLAARAHIMRPQAGSDPGFMATNVEGTRVLMEEAAAAGVRKLIFFSSVKAVGEENSLPWTEDVVPRPVDPYGVSKLRAEETVRELGATSGIGTVILRLPLAYGPWMKGNMLRLFEAVKHSIPLPLLTIENRRSMVFSENAAEAVHCVIRSPDSVDQTFFVSDGSDLSTPELLRAVGIALGETPSLFAMPEGILRAAGRFADFLAPALPLPVNGEIVQRLLGSLTVDISKLRRLAGYRPPFTVEAGLRATASWYAGGAGTS
jgi:nucleoside-diphosphate-sugar epimerase